MNQLAKTLIGLGIALVLAGAALLVLQRLGLGRLPPWARRWLHSRT